MKMRTTLSFVLVSMLVLQPLFAGAQELALGDRLRNMSREAERFRESLPEREREWSHGRTGVGQSNEEVERARLRVRIQDLPPGKKISVVTRGGGPFVGELIEARAEDFLLWVDLDSGNGKIKKRLTYDELERAVLPEWNGWMPPEKIGSWKENQKVELLLVNGTKAKGRLLSVSRVEWFLKTKGEETQRFSFDDIASVRKAGMGRAAKVAIVSGVVFASLVIVTLATWDTGCLLCSGGLL
jgi:hypothetical protein